jgi:hypothetical protein
MFETVTSTFHNVAVASIRKGGPFKEAASSFENRFRNLGPLAYSTVENIDYTHDSCAPLIVQDDVEQ